jgi:hypothetical protein
MGIKGRINVAFLLIGIRSVFGIAYNVAPELNYSRKATIRMLVGLDQDISLSLWGNSKENQCQWQFGPL